MLIDLEELAGEIASKVDGAGLTPVIDQMAKIMPMYGFVASTIASICDASFSFRGGYSCGLRPVSGRCGCRSRRKR